MLAGSYETYANFIWAWRCKYGHGGIIINMEILYLHGMWKYSQHKFETYLANICPENYNKNKYQRTL